MPDRILTICAAGGSGAGKSSTLDALFGTRFTAVAGDLTTVDLPGVRLLDTPGLGEDRRRDQVALAAVAGRLPDCDVVLWLLTCRNRALSADLAYLEALAVPTDRLIFGVNQVDLAEPADWNAALGLPSEAQEQNILELLEDRRARLATCLGVARPVIGYSATRRFRLQELFSQLVAASPPGRAAALRAAKALRPAPHIRLEREARRERAQQKLERGLKGRA
jgi:predicted GTPase